MNVKFCGITRKQDAILAARLGAWGVGFIFYLKSPRFILPENVAAITRELPERIAKVGVFVNASSDEVLATARVAGLNAVQLHGDETPDFCKSISATYSVIKAFRPRKDTDVEAMSAFKSSYALLVDAAVDGFWGGTGRISEWSLAVQARRHGNLILSGGLSPSNVADAILSVKPFAVDVSSGVEEAPGVKSAEKMESFMMAALRATESLGRQT